MVSTAGSQAARRSKSLKTDLSSDCSLKLDYMKLESLVKADHNAALNTFSGLVLTARHVKRVGGCPKVAVERPKAKPAIGTKS